MLKSVFKLFAGDPHNNPQDRFIHLDGSSAYSSGFSRLIQRDDIRFVLAHCALVAAIDIAARGFGISNIFNDVAAVATGGLLHSWLRTEMDHGICKKFPAFKKFGGLKSVYDRTGQTASKDQAQSIMYANIRLAGNALLVPLASFLFNLSMDMRPEVTPFVYHLMAGFSANFGFSLVARVFRNRMISDRHYTFVNDLPELPERRSALVPSMG